jgi:hypothetical protein
MIKLNARVRDVRLLDTDVKTAIERILEIEGLVRSPPKGKLKIEIRKYLTLGNRESSWYDLQEIRKNSKSKIGLPIPLDNPLVRTFNDGNEYICDANGFGNVLATLRANVSGGNVVGINYIWNITDGGIYAAEIDKSTMEVDWKE